MSAAMARGLNHRPWVVMKFGGTSVSSRERWETIGREANLRAQEGLSPFVVCSALSGISNGLEELLTQALRGSYGEVLTEIKQRHLRLGAALGVETDALLEESFAELDRIALGASLVGEGSPRLRARVMAMGELMSTK